MDIKKIAESMENVLLEKVANRNIRDYSIKIDPDNRVIDVTTIFFRYITNIKSTVSLRVPKKREHNLDKDTQEDL